MEKELLSKDVLCGNFSASRYHVGSEITWRDSVEYPNRKEFGKTLFLVYNGVLRQFRIKQVVVFPFSWGIRRHDAHSNYGNVTTLEVAGVGILNVGLYMYGGDFSFKIYESIEDYKNGKEYKMSYTRTTREGCEKRFGVNISDRNLLGEYSIRRWYWNGTSSYLDTIPESIPICYIVKKDGIEFPDGWSQEDISGYATKEECDNDNSIEICCFDNEEIKEPEKEKVIRLSIEIKESDIEKIKSLAKVVD